MDHKLDDILCSSFMGYLTKSKLVLNKPKDREIELNEIAFVEYKKKRVYLVNYVFGLIAILFFVFGLFFDSTVILLIVIPCFGVCLFFSRYEFYVQIILRNPEKIFIGINKKHRAETLFFTRKVNKVINEK